MTTLSDKAARRFYEALKPGAEWSYSNDAVIPLIKAAFALYADDWSPAKIGQWEWPFKMLVDGGSFDGDQPWTILLRRAVEMAKSPAPGLSVNKVLAVPQFLLDEATIGVLLASAKDCVATAAKNDAVLKPFIAAAEAELTERGYPADYMANAANDTVDALVQAEAFIRGFEGDELQEGITDMLAGLRAAIMRERARPDLLAEAKELLCKAEYADGLATVHTQDCEALEAAIAAADGIKPDKRAEFIEMIARLSASGDDMGEGEPAWEHDTGDGLDTLDALIHKARKLAGMAHDADRAAMADPVSVRLVPEAEGDANG